MRSRLIGTVTSLQIVCLKRRSSAANSFHLQTPSHELSRQVIAKFFLDRALGMLDDDKLRDRPSPEIDLAEGT
jgi:hypothetical protein